MTHAEALIRLAWDAAQDQDMTGLAQQVAPDEWSEWRSALVSALMECGKSDGTPGRDAVGVTEIDGEAIYWADNNGCSEWMLLCDVYADVKADLVIRDILSD